MKEMVFKDVSTINNFSSTKMWAYRCWSMPDLPKVWGPGARYEKGRGETKRLDTTSMGRPQKCKAGNEA